MTDSIAIPRSKGKQRLVASSADSSPRTPHAQHHDDRSLSSTASGDSEGTMASILAEQGPLHFEGFGVGRDTKKVARQGAATQSRFGHERRTSLLSSSISKSEHTVINIGDDDRPRLITCVKASQGFDWNQDIFLPSYLSDRDHQSDLERRQDPVEDIFISEEEAQDMFPC